MGDKINSKLDCSFYFFRVVFSFRIVEMFFSHLHALYSSLTVQFSKTILPSSLRQPHYSITKQFLCQHLFLIFLLFLPLSTKNTKRSAFFAHFWSKSAGKAAVFQVLQGARSIYAKRQIYAHARVYN